MSPYTAGTLQLKNGADDWNVWYVRAADGTGEQLLWDAGKPYEGELLIHSMNYHLGMYAAIMAVICLLFLGAFYAMKRIGKPRLWEISFRIAALAGSLSLSTVIVTAGQFMELWGEFTEGVQEGTILALPMVLAILFARKLYLLRCEDKGL